MSKAVSPPADGGHPATAERQSSQFARSRWFHVLALADQLRQDTELKRDEQLRQFAFDLPAADKREAIVIASVAAQADHIESFQNELLFAKTGNFNLDTLSDNFVDLKRTFNRMLEMNKDDVQQVTLATKITRAALLMVLRSTESIVEVVTKGTRKCPTLTSIISFIRSRNAELPIHGGLLVEWYRVSQALDLLINDPDWLVQPRKAHWAMKVCNDTLMWARAVFNETYRTKSAGRPIFDRDDSIIIPEPRDKP